MNDLIEAPAMWITKRRMSRGILVLVVALLGSAAVGRSQEITLGKPGDRHDRLVTITGENSENLVAEYSLNAGATGSLWW